MASKRLSVTARIRKASTVPKSNLSEKATISTMPAAAPQHYNDWPNAVGFDTPYEELQPVELSVKGHIPAWTAGTLFRTGIGPRSVKDKNDKVVFKVNHWFDGFSQVHRFQLHGPADSNEPNAKIERVTYQCRLTSDKLLDRVQKTGKMDDFTFAAQYEPCKSFFQKIQSVFEKSPVYAPNEVNNAVTLSINYPGLSNDGSPDASPYDKAQTVTLCNKTDSARMQFLNPKTLEPTGLSMQSNLNSELKGAISAAHPEVDPVSGDVYNFNLDFGSRLSTYRVFRTSAATGKTSVLATYDHAGAYLHSLFLTKYFVVLCIWNSHFSMAGASILWQRNLLDAMYFNKSPATWLVVDRRCPKTEGGKGIVAKFNSDPFFAFHSINAYEVPSPADDGTLDIICDIPVYSDMSVMHLFYMDQLQSSNPKSHEQARRIAEGRYDNALARLRRYRLPGINANETLSSSQKTIPEAIVEFTAPAALSMELPTMHPAYATKPYRYVYGIQGPDGNKSTFVDGLVKYDLHTHQTVKWEVKGHTPGEAIFIPTPGEGKDEDDGVLLSVILDGYTSKSYLLCLNAKDLSEMGRAEVDGAIGFGFHGVHTTAL